jgi:hypothetical protein
MSVMSHEARQVPSWLIFDVGQRTMYFITPPAKVVADALEAWGWIGIADRRPILITAFADVFFDSSDGVWFLDTLEGKLKRVCGTRVELESILATEEGKDLYLLSGFIDRAVRESMLLKEEECYDFRVHPVVGGAIDYSNVTTISFLVALHLRGQLHDQVRHLKPGTKISKFTFAENPTSKPWWKPW